MRQMTRIEIDAELDQAFDSKQAAEKRRDSLQRKYANRFDVGQYRHDYKQAGKWQLGHRL